MAEDRLCQMKKQLRREIRSLRDALPLSEREEYSRRICQWIVESPEYHQANRIFCFLSMGSEVDTTPLINRAWADGKKVAVPVARANRQLYFLDITEFSSLQTNKMGIREPEGNLEEAVTPGPEDLFLTPCVAFDKHFQRLGYGGGYYDTYLACHRGFCKIGVAFQGQVLDRPLPVEQYDLPVDGIVTEYGWIRRNEN